MRRHLVSLLSVLAAVAVLPATATARPTRVSLTFDDGVASQYQTRAMLAAHGMRATYYVNAGLFGDDPYYMTWPQLDGLASDGNEVGGHSYDHPDLTTLTASQQAQEICGDRDALVARGYSVTSFAYPFARWNASARDTARQCGYSSARGVGNVGCANCVSAETIPPTDPYVLRTAAGITDTTTLAEMQGYVTNAMQNGGGWVILVFHSICDSCGDSNSTTAARLEALLTWLQDQQANGVSVHTVREAMALPAPPPPANLLQNANLETLSGSAGPSCWARSQYVGATGAGNVGTWSDTADAHAGANAEQISISSYADGDQKILSVQDLLAAQPVIGSATPVSGGTLSGTQYYRVSSTTANGETPASPAVSATANGSVKVTWGAAKGATGYRVYRGSASGQEKLLASVGAVTSYTDTGAATPGSATPPTTNTAVRGTPCSPSAIPGDVYQVSAWYKTSAGANVRMIAYYRDAGGNWVFWREQPLPATTSWAQAQWQTPLVPAGATALSVGFSLRSAGTATVDDVLTGDLSG